MILKALSRLRQIACHPMMLEDFPLAESGKFNEVIRNVKTLISEGHKILMFSSFVKHLELYSSYFDRQKIAYVMMTGASTHREQIINEFKKG